MGQRWTFEGRPEWDVELITLDQRRVFRVRHFRMLLGYYATTAEMDRALKLYGLTAADLVEVDG
jgi:hypothetical protein